MTKPNTKIRIRRITPKDASDYAKISWDTDLRKYLMPFTARTVSDAEALIKRETSVFSPNMLAIFYRNTLVGAMTVTYCCADATVSYFIGRQYRQRGYAKESLLVLSEIIEHKHPEIKQILFSIRRENEASIRVQRSLGSEVISETKKHLHFAYRIRNN